jgi:hypothetical protein
MALQGSILFRPLTELGPELGGRGKDKGRRTIGRKKKIDPDFPRVHWWNGRGYIQAEEWEAYKKILIRRGLENTRELPPAVCSQQNPIDAAVADIFDAICGALNREPGIAAYDLGELLCGAHASVKKRLRDLLGENTHTGVAL